MDYRKNKEGRAAANKHFYALFAINDLEGARAFVSDTMTSLGRTERWQKSCRWLIETYDVVPEGKDVREYRRWACLQAVVWFDSANA